MLLADPFDILQGDVVDLTADALHGVLGGSRDVGTTLFPQMLQAVLEERALVGWWAGEWLLGCSSPCFETGSATY